jgi:hypothetical protein
MRWGDRYAILNENTANTAFEPHYTYHPAWAARVIRRLNPNCHVDISSSLHFCTMVSAFLPVEFYDYRPARITLSGLTTGHCDLTRLHFQTDSIDSLSCMHVIEHIGLGRYGDPLDPDGDLKAVTELKRVVSRGGSLLFVVPTGRPRIQFNAHRIYSPSQVLEMFSGWELVEFALVDDRGSFAIGADLSIAAGQGYGCGCYWFRKAA